jgi:hypothetical protein
LLGAVLAGEGCRDDLNWHVWHGGLSWWSLLRVGRRR